MTVSHASQFAVELIGKHEARTTGMIFHAFSNVGNQLPGVGPEGQKESLREMLRADDRLRYDVEADSWTDDTEAELPDGEGAEA